MEAELSKGQQRPSLLQVMALEGTEGISTKQSADQSHKESQERERT